ncbi:MAG: glycosyltransferase family 39 protein [Gammaproteobacteria bacterium]|nr:glycosyltransferase family 39 protein [Gammaproteobacteria bacterium]
MRILVVTASPYGLYLEEPYYWAWAQQPDWGYYSKPPLVAWLIAITTTWSDEPLAVKASAIALYPLAGWFVLQTTRLFADERVALRTALLFQLLPGVSFSAIIISTDVPLILCWSATLWLAFTVLRQPRPWHWPALGATIGLGLLAKYNMLLLLPGLLLWGWRYQRPQLLQQWRGMMLAIAIAMLLITPTLLWNLNHQLTSVHHTIAITGARDSSWQWSALGQFMLDQLALLGPVAGLVTAWLLLTRPSSIRPLLWTLAPALLATAWIAGFGEANANWGAPLVATLVIGCGLWAANSVRRWYWLFIPNIIIVSLFYGLHGSGAVDRLSELYQFRHPYQRILGWPAVTKQILDAQARLPEPCLISPSRELLAWSGYLGRHMLPPQALISLPPADGSVAHQFDLVNPLRQGMPQTRCVLVVGTQQRHLADAFGSRQQRDEVTRQGQGQNYEHYLLFEVSDWQGGGR